ncbi:hypothetical protein FB45DRAFT_781870 [Roridomyces roridus]|uniref:Uncharacterized protein n=1 Tax=Roridomyces roridus TaxID=1738132 RepID=A0AAD7CF44_9AGAR|nr:hypothetical protein FB45DRAFT_781870 [Roridomyces roridus]
MAAQFAPTRDSNSIQLHLSTNQPAPSVPVEIRGEIGPDAWAVRLKDITTTASRYNKVILERVWMTAAFFAVIIVPLALYQPILSAVHLKSDPTVDHAIEARAISFALLPAILLFFFVPLAVWKYIGRKQVNLMLKKWAREDGPAAKSTWTVKTPGVFSTDIILRIQLPPGVPVSGFTFSAFNASSLPSYINGPADPEADSYYYPYEKTDPDVPRMSVIGNIPLFKDEKKSYRGLEEV